MTETTASGAVVSLLKHQHGAFYGFKGKALLGSPKRTV